MGNVSKEVWYGPVCTTTFELKKSVQTSAVFGILTLRDICVHFFDSSDCCGPCFFTWKYASTTALFGNLKLPTYSETLSFCGIVLGGALFAQLNLEMYLAPKWHMFVISRVFFNHAGSQNIGMFNFFHCYPQLQTAQNFVTPALSSTQIVPKPNQHLALLCIQIIDPCQSDFAAPFWKTFPILFFLVPSQTQHDKAIRSHLFSRVVLPACSACTSIPFKALNYSFRSGIF